MAEPLMKTIRRGLCFSWRRGEGGSRAPERYVGRTATILEMKTGTDYLIISFVKSYGETNVRY
ncbi:MAG: hypothetical protein H6Q64_488 [Firmicutes bacterium]|nr:hypothetical protein [Bacillota bacterium]